MLYHFKMMWLFYFKPDLFALADTLRKCLDAAVTLDQPAAQSVKWSGTHPWTDPVWMPSRMVDYMWSSRTGRREDLSDTSRPAQRQCHPTGARTPTGSNRLGWTRSGMTWEQEYSRSIHARAWLSHATWNSIRILPGTAGWMGINGGSSCGQHTESLCLVRCGTMCVNFALEMRISTVTFSHSLGKFWR